jgi:hypothetical protein
MEFVRRKKRGQDKKVRRTWFSEERYRIIWRKEAFGIRVPARFMATVRIVLPPGERQMWDFVDSYRHLYKSIKAAQDACEKHYQLWTKACEASGVRALRELFGGKLPFGVPCWVRNTIPRKLLTVLLDPLPIKLRDDEEDECDENDSLCNGSNPSYPSEISTSSESEVSHRSPPGSSATIPTSGPASIAKEPDDTSIPAKRTRRSRPTTPSPAPFATARDAEPKRLAKSPTTQRSAPGIKKTTPTKPHKKSAGKRSRNSRQPKSKSSET